MGGDYYQRQVISSAGGAYGNNVVGKVHQLNKGLDPKTYVIDQGPIVTQVKNPIVFALDVTGSMGDWPKIIYDKMPMFYGQIMMQKYLENPALSFCAIGDVTSDQAPLQVTKFGQGKEIDELISKMWLEGGGGTGYYESYQASAYFYNRYSKIEKAQLPFFFVTGDQGYYDNPPYQKYKDVFGQNPKGNVVNGRQEWKNIMSKFNVFHLKKKYSTQVDEIQINKQWSDTLGKQRVIMFQTPKASIDIILGLIALTSGVRTLSTYINDMRDRGQDQQRIKEVQTALSPYAQKIASKKVKIVSNLHQSKPNQNINDFRIQYLAQISKDKHSQNRQILNRIQEQFANQVSESIVCPISKQIIQDPVIAADGYTYERKAIEKWLVSNKTSPVDNSILQSVNLISNNAIKKQIQTWKQKKLEKK